MSLTLDELQDILTQAGLDTNKRREVAKIAAQYEAEKKQDAKEDKNEGGSKNKYRYVAFVRGSVALQDQLEGGAWLVSVADAIANPENKDAKKIDVVQHLMTCAARQNEKLTSKVAGRKGKGGMIARWADCFNWMRPKTLKANGNIMKVKTKMPVEIIVLTDELVPFAGTAKQNSINKTPMEQIIEKTT